VILRWPHRLPWWFGAAVEKIARHLASSRADTRRALPPPPRRSARRRMVKQKADGKEWSLVCSPFPLTGVCHLSRWLLPTLPDRLAAPRSLRSVALHSAPFPRRRTVWSAVGEPRGGGTARVEKECDQEALDARNRTRGDGAD